MKPRFFWFVFVVGTLALGACRGSTPSSKAKEGTGPQPVAITVTHPIRQSLRQILPLNTVLKSKVRARVFPDAPAKFLRFTVAEGDTVVKHQIVAELERDIPGLTFQTLKVRAPVRGIVHLYDLSEGMPVAPQVPLLEILQMDTLEFVLRLPEEYRNVLQPGESVQLVVDQDTVFARITLVAPTLDPRTGTQEVRGLVPAQGNLLPGLTARVLVPVLEKENALTLPRDAVLGEVTKFVFVVRKGKAWKVPVKTGIETYRYIEILSGITESDTVVRLGASSLKDGQPVRIQEL